MSTMHYPGPTGTAALIVLALGAIGADILVRLVLAPRRRDAFINELLDGLAGPLEQTEPASAQEQGPRAAEITEGLLRHFERSMLSQRILSKLADDEQGLGQRELIAALNRSQSERGRPALSLAVVRRVAATLLHAGLIGIESGALSITALGRELNRVLVTRKETRFDRSVEGVKPALP